MSHLQIIRVKKEHQTVLENLMQFYLYDFSIYFCGETDGHVDHNGLFPLEYDLRRYIEGKGDGNSQYWAYLARVDSRWAGFALVSDRCDQMPQIIYPPDTPGRNMDEFFVLRCFRRQGIGQQMAHFVFDTVKGFWQIAQIMNNTPAQAFWRATIGSYTGGYYTDYPSAKTGEVIIWQTFDSSRFE